MVESCFRRRHSSSLKTAKCFVINCILSPPKFINLGRGLLDAESSPPPIPSPRTGKISENNGHAQPNCAWLLFLKSNWFSGGSACETDLILRLKGWDADFFWMEMWPPVTIHPSFIWKCVTNLGWVFNFHIWGRLRLTWYGSGYQSKIATQVSRTLLCKFCIIMIWCD